MLNRNHIQTVLSLITGPKALATFQDWNPDNRELFLRSLLAQTVSDRDLQQAVRSIAQALDAQTVDAKQLFGAMADAKKRRVAVDQAAAALCGTAQPSPEATDHRSAAQLDRIELQLGQVRDQLGELILSSQPEIKPNIGADSIETVRGWLEDYVNCSDLTTCKQHKGLIGFTQVLYELFFTAEQVEAVLAWLVTVEKCYKKHRKEVRT